jgi:hypothetical protein
LMVALMKKAASLPANALARAIRLPALRIGALPEQSSYQSARDASIMTHYTMRISGFLKCRAFAACFVRRRDSKPSERRKAHTSVSVAP